MSTFLYMNSQQHIPELPRETSRDLGLVSSSQRAPLRALYSCTKAAWEDIFAAVRRPSSWNQGLTVP